MSKCFTGRKNEYFTALCSAGRLHPLPPASCPVRTTHYKSPKCSLGGSQGRGESEESVSSCTAVHWLNRDRSMWRGVWGGVCRGTRVGEERNGFLADVGRTQRSPETCPLPLSMNPVGETQEPWLRGTGTCQRPHCQTQLCMLIGPGLQVLWECLGPLRAPRGSYFQTRTSPPPRGPTLGVP